jgi:hypothetical protein
MMLRERAGGLSIFAMEECPWRSKWWRLFALVNREPVMET